MDFNGFSAAFIGKHPIATHQSHSQSPCHLLPPKLPLANVILGVKWKCDKCGELVVKYYLSGLDYIIDGA